MNEKQDQPDQEKGVLFRQQAFDSAASPEEFLIAFRPVTYYRSIVIVATSLLLISAVGWFIWGSIPITIEGRGIAMKPQGLFSVQAKEGGIVKKILVGLGEYVHKGQLLISLDDPEKEKQYLSTLEKYNSLTGDVRKLREEIQKELQAQKESIQLQIVATQASINDIQSSIVQLEGELKVKQDLFNQHLLGLQQLYETQQLLSERRIELAKARVVLATHEATLTKSYREEELIEKEHSLLETKQKLDLLKLGLDNLNLVSNQEGVVLEILVNPSDRVIVGTPLIRLEATTLGDKQGYIFYAFIPPDTGKQVQVGTKVQIEVSTVRAEEYGAIVGEVTQVSPYPVSREAIGNRIQNQGLVDFLENHHETVMQIVVTPEADPKSPSGYRWTSGIGPSAQITVGTVAVIKGIATKVSPIHYLVSLWRFEEIEKSIERFFEKHLHSGAPETR